MTEKIYPKQSINPFGPYIGIICVKNEDIALRISQFLLPSICAPSYASRVLNQLRTSLLGNMIQNKGSNYHKSAFYEDKSANIVSYRTPNFATFNCIISNILTYLGDGNCYVSSLGYG